MSFALTIEKDFSFAVNSNLISTGIISFSIICLTFSFEQKIISDIIGDYINGVIQIQNSKNQYYIDDNLSCIIIDFFDKRQKQTTFTKEKVLSKIFCSLVL